MRSSSYFPLLFCMLCVAAAPCNGSLFGSSDDIPVGRFKAYLRIATVHPVPDYKPPVEFLLAQAKEIGLEAQTLEYVKGKPVTLLTWKGTNPSLPSILLNSHVDVVPAEKDKWENEPFAAVEVCVLCILDTILLACLLHVFSIPLKFVVCECRMERETSSPAAPRT